MRLGINGFFWGRETTGSGQYIRQLLHALLTVKDQPECLLFRPGDRESHSQSATLGLGIDEHFLPSPIPLSANVSKLWFEQISYPRACLERKIDVGHVPYFAPPLQASDRMVVTIHDLIPLILPGYQGSLMVRLYSRLVAATARRAAAIVTDSRSSKKDITQMLGIPPGRVHVVYLGINEAFKPVTDDEELYAMRQKYGLEDEYILYLGGFDRRKNVSTLLTAFASMDPSSKAKANLVIAGRLPVKDTPFFPHPRLMVEKLGLQDKVNFIGWVPEKDKPALYSGASLFVFPSLYEGFGLPPLEAMACGTAVITSDRSSLPEVAGEGAWLVNPDHSDELAGAMKTLIEDQRRRRELAAKGVEQARRFSWQRTVSETMAIYQSVAAR